VFCPGSAASRKSWDNIVCRSRNPEGARIWRSSGWCVGEWNCAALLAHKNVSVFQHTITGEHLYISSHHHFYLYPHECCDLNIFFVASDLSPSLFLKTPLNISPPSPPLIYFHLSNQTPFFRSLIFIFFNYTALHSLPLPFPLSFICKKSFCSFSRNIFLTLTLIGNVNDPQNSPMVVQNKKTIQKLQPRWLHTAPPHLPNVTDPFYSSFMLLRTWVGKLRKPNVSIKRPRTPSPTLTSGCIFVPRVGLPYLWDEWSRWGTATVTV